MIEGGTVQELLEENRRLEAKARRVPCQGFMGWMMGVVIQAVSVENRIVDWLVENVPRDLLLEAAGVLAECEDYEWEEANASNQD